MDSGKNFTMGPMAEVLIQQYTEIIAVRRNFTIK